MVRGIRTGFQFAFFVGQGSFTDVSGERFKEMGSSYGVGFRLLLFWVIIRADLATVEEGNVFQLFVNYPWSMFAVDNPG